MSSGLLILTQLNSETHWGLERTRDEVWAAAAVPRPLVLLFSVVWKQQNAVHQKPPVCGYPWRGSSSTTRKNVLFSAEGSKKTLAENRWHLQDSFSAIWLAYENNTCYPTNNSLSLQTDVSQLTMLEARKEDAALWSEKVFPQKDSASIYRVLPKDPKGPRESWAGTDLSFTLFCVMQWWHSPIRRLPAVLRVFKREILRAKNLKLSDGKLQI